MESSRDEILFATLESLRPAPRPAFAAELDARAAAGFPRSSAPEAAPLQRALAQVRWLKPRQLVFAGGSVALATVAVATFVIASGPTNGSGTPSAALHSKLVPAERTPTPKQIEEAFDAASQSRHSSIGRNDSAGAEYEASTPTASAAESGSEETLDSLSTVPQAESGPYASQAHHRDVEYAAEIVLGTKPEDVGDAAGKVFGAVHQYGGIVLDSSVRGGSADDGRAEFELLVPSAKLSDALAAFSGIAEVRSRHETSNDITALTVTTTELLQDSHARIESLLDELADAETELQREVAEAKLRSERRHAAQLKSSLANLQRRAGFSHVSLRIESDESSSSAAPGGWDVGDAFHDAGQILAVAAGVTIVGLAVLGPIALIVLLAWLANRAWVRQRRERALG